ncbi:MAG: hypothetical protein QNJ98_10915 [Planctomycetota bacterium]|nr:hypothetical protein [Planctomycetota bacterium]
MIRLRSSARAPGWRPGLFQLALCVALAFLFLGPAVAEDEKKDEVKPKAKPPHGLGTRVGEANREQMWPAPTAEDWAKPCLLTFQRTWDDALAIAKETGKPILICINMDGEIASEHWAGKRYRQPEVAKLYEPYVCVIASVYRHTPRDYDDAGKRILCPRFGSVTCGEHIAIEPVIFEKFCDGRRIAPRHIAVDVEGKEEAYDVYYVNDTAGVMDAIYEGRDKFPEGKPPIVRGDRPILERVASRHVEDRVAVENAYKKGDAELRKKLLEAAIKHKDAAQLDLLRLAIFGLDVDLSKVARAALAKTDTPIATMLINEALRVPMDAAERDALIAALKRLGDSSALARWLAGVHKGLAGGSGSVDATGWMDADPTQPSPTAVPQDVELGAEVERRAREAYEQPESPESRLEFAEATLALAQEAKRLYPNNQRRARMTSEHLYRDAKQAALEAEHLGATGWRVNSVIALSAYYTGDIETAYGHAAKAVAEIPAGDSGWSSMAVVTIFAESRFKAIKKAVKAKEDWPSEWLGDLHAAYSILMRHPLGTDGQVVWHYEFLVWLGAEHRAARVLQEGIGRFQNSLELHKRLRDRLLKKRGARGLEGGYGRMLEKTPDSATLTTFAGYASIVAAQHHRRMRRYEQSLEAYGRAIALYEKAIEQDEAFKEVSDHAIALAHAARARVAYLKNDDDTATDEIVTALTRSPDATGTRDEMGFTPGETAQMLLARLNEDKREAQAKRVAEALSKVPQELLRPDIGLGPGGR